MRFLGVVLITFIATMCKTSESQNEYEMEYLQNDNETLQDDNCTKSLWNLQQTYNKTSEELTLTWESNTAEECSFQYKAEITEYSRINTNITSPVINTTSYIFRGVKPCTKYNASVEMFQDDESSAQINLSDTVETDIITFNHVENLNISTTTNKILFNWTAHKHADICNIHYIITVNDEIPYFRFVNSTEHIKENLQSCTEYNVSVTPSNAPRHEFDSDTPYLIRTVSTLPEAVSNLTIVHNGSTFISWIPPANNRCIKKYKITKTFNGTTSVEDVTSNYFESSENLYCMEVKVEAVTRDEQLGASVLLSKPGPVNNLKGTPTDTSIFVEWEPPTNGSCVANYSVQISDQPPVTTELHNHTFTNLTACESYEIKVTARSLDSVLGDEHTKTIKTLEPTEIGLLENFNYTIQENLVNVTWETPLNAGACHITYKLSISDTDSTDIIYRNETIEMFDEIDSTTWIGCKNYTLSVTPLSKSTEGDITEVFITIPKVTNPPNCTEVEVDETEAILECILDDYETNLCAISEVIIECEASEIDNGNESWIKWNAIGSEITGDDARQINITLTDITPFTNYICRGVVLNEGGNSTIGEPVQIQTPEGVPSAPEIYDIIPRNKSFHFKWREPEVLHGILQKYNIIIETENSWYFTPTDDNCPSRNETYENEITEPPWNEYDFVNAYPGYTYNIYINASTNAGYGPWSVRQVQTLAGVPEEPRNVNYSVTAATTKVYNVNVTVMWTFPCYTNGEITNFAIDLFGIPQVDKHKANDTRENLSVKLNEVLEDLNYEYTITKLQPAFNYTVYVKAVPKEDVGSDKTKFQFVSPESYPEAPLLKPISKVTENAFTVEWDKPPSMNGILRGYTVTIVNEGPLYWVPKDKTCSRNIENYTHNVPPEKTSFTFKNGIPYHKYSVVVSASTSVGSGPPSAAEVVETLESEPKPIRNLKTKLKDSSNEEYNAHVKFSFAHPCDTFGPLKQFTVILYGERSNYSPHEKILNITDQLEQEQYEYSEEMLAEYEYTLKVNAETQSSKSIISEEKFKSSSGIPRAVTKKIATPVPHSFTQAKFSFGSQLFDEKNGEILYYALILGENNYEEKSLFDFWEGNDETWPAINNEVVEEGRIEPYQATPNFWTPFKECACDNYTFILGDPDYSELNKPLQEGVNYTIKVRGFTQRGYRDSSSATFEMPVASNLALILGVTSGIVGTGIILGCFFILWRKRTQWETKKEFVKSIPLTPLPVSVKQFPEHYSELKNNSEKLKQEYALLGTKSNEVILPSYEGLLPENKKKNRYTNIIPYDQTRVKLLDTNDNYSTSDYINASYIQGYSGDIEYIATQGPLEHTCMDFWRMVIQENSTLIIMVAQFVEQNKDKCYKYFPNNHENMELENGIAIRCCTELNFNTHIVRTLLVQKDLQQLTVTHLQFTNWPDFGCPTGTDVILEFCQLMREHAEKNPDPIIVHCSAGVGRTGTLIALDIILQVINRKRDIDIFGTVLNLRRDRKNMVQTEKQYLYIHTCINESLQNPAPIQCEDISKEPIYENLEDIKKDQSDDNIVESKF